MLKNSNAAITKLPSKSENSVLLSVNECSFDKQYSLLCILSLSPHAVLAQDEIQNYHASLEMTDATLLTALIL